MNQLLEETTMINEQQPIVQERKTTKMTEEDCLKKWQRYMFTDKDNPLTESEIEHGLVDDDSLIRRAVVKMLIKISPSQIEQILRDGSPLVVEAGVKRMDYTLTSAQIERGLKSDKERVVTAFLSRDDVHPDKKQIAYGLNHNSAGIRVAWIKNLKLSDMQSIERDDISWLLSDHSPSVRLIAIQKFQVVPSAEEIWRGLKDTSPIVREAWAKNLNFTPTYEQARCGLMDEDWDVLKAWLTRNDYPLKDHLSIISELSDQRKISFKKEIEARLDREQEETIGASSVLPL